MWLQTKHNLAWHVNDVTTIAVMNWQKLVLGLLISEDFVILAYVILIQYQHKTKGWSTIKLSWAHKC